MQGKKWILLIVAAITSQISYAHDKTRPDLDSWFNGLGSGNGLCCSSSDGETVADADWEVKNGRYRVFIHGRWVDVPTNALVTVPNKFGRTMVWPYADGTIRCFMPGPLT